MLARVVVVWTGRRVCSAWAAVHCMQWRRAPGQHTTRRVELKVGSGRSTSNNRQIIGRAVAPGRAHFTDTRHTASGQTTISRGRALGWAGPLHTNTE